MSIVKQIYVVAYANGLRKPEEITVGILTKQYESIDDVFNTRDEAEIGRYGEYPSPTHVSKGFYYAVEKTSVIALTTDLAVLDKIMAKVSNSMAKVSEIRSELQAEIISLVE